MTGASTEETVTKSILVAAASLSVITLAQPHNI